MVCWVDARFFLPKEHFWSLDETEERVEPKFTVQVWDNDLISADDFLGNPDDESLCLWLDDNNEQERTNPEGKAPVCLDKVSQISFQEPSSTDTHVHV